MLPLQVLPEPHSWCSLPVANRTRTAGHLFRMLDLQRALVALRCALASRARLGLVRRLSVIGGRKVMRKAALLKDLPAVLTPVTDCSCGESLWEKGYCRLNGLQYKPL
uniref:Uncharacterized protein n=1 Tax=Ixodes ricinus TaxID=34613 RepID=A0A6B0UGW1_IXORI